MSATPEAPRRRKKVVDLMTRSDREFIAAYAQSRTLVEAGRLWGKSRGVDYASSDSAGAQAGRKLRDLQKKIARMGDAEMFWEYLGLGLNKIAGALADGMDATTIVPMKLRGGGGDVIVEAGPYIDHPTRIDAAMSAAKLRGDIRKVPNVAGGDNNEFKFLFILGGNATSGNKD
jgi:hypothetical protein